MAISIISHEEFQILRGSGQACCSEDVCHQRVPRPPAPVIYFRGKEEVYSNMYEFRLTIFNRTFCSTESAYQYAKAVFHKNWDIAEDLVNTRSGLHAKALSHLISKSEKDLTEWRKFKVDIMKAILYAKVEQCSEFRLLLTDVNLRDTILVENTENEFWGYANGKGMNALGCLLMNLRQEFVDLKISPREIAHFITEVMHRMTDYWPDKNTWKQLLHNAQDTENEMLNFRPIYVPQPSPCALTSSPVLFNTCYSPGAVTGEAAVSLDNCCDVSVHSIGCAEDIDLGVSSCSLHDTSNENFGTCNSLQSCVGTPVKAVPSCDKKHFETTEFNHNEFGAGFFLGFLAGGLLMQYYNEMHKKLSTNLSQQPVRNDRKRPCKLMKQMFPVVSIGVIPRPPLSLHVSSASSRAASPGSSISENLIPEHLYNDQVAYVTDYLPPRPCSINGDESIDLGNHDLPSHSCATYESNPNDLRNQDLRNQVNRKQDRVPEVTRRTNTRERSSSTPSDPDECPQITNGPHNLQQEQVGDHSSRNLQQEQVDDNSSRNLQQEQVVDQSSRNLQQEQVVDHSSRNLQQEQVVDQSSRNLQQEQVVDHSSRNLQQEQVVDHSSRNLQQEQVVDHSSLRGVQKKVENAEGVEQVTKERPGRGRGRGRIKKS